MLCFFFFTGFDAIGSKKMARIARCSVCVAGCVCCCDELGFAVVILLVGIGKMTRARGYVLKNGGFTIRSSERYVFTRFLGICMKSKGVRGKVVLRSSSFVMMVEAMRCIFSF